MQVDALWRYPVKSMMGERLQCAEIDHRGVRGDRLYAIYDRAGKIGSGKNSRTFRRFDGMRFIQVGVDEHGEPALRLPDGTGADIAAVREFLGDPDIELRREEGLSHFDALPLHLLSRQDLDRVAAELDRITVDERRFRPNLVIDGPIDGCLGGTVEIGSVTIEVVEPTERCVMVNASEPGIERTGEVLTYLTRERRMEFGVYARVLVPGVVRVGDPVRLL